MKKILMILTACILLAGCSQKETPTGSTRPTTRPTIQPVIQSNIFDYAGYDWLAQLEKDAFSEDGTLGAAVEEAVQLHVTATTENTVTVTVRAPYIKDALLAWYDEQPDFSSQALDETILSLLQEDQTEQSFTLNYTLVDELPVIHYSDDYAKVLSCGISEFYDLLYTRILEQIGGSEDV